MRGCAISHRRYFAGKHKILRIFLKKIYEKTRTLGGERARPCTFFLWLLLHSIAAIFPPSSLPW